MGFPPSSMFRQVYNYMTTAFIVKGFYATGKKTDATRIRDAKLYFWGRVCYNPLAEVMRLYTVAICEDEIIFRNEQEKICRETLRKLNIEYHITMFETSTDFYAAFSNGARYDLILLDIIIDETNGVDLARKIREYDVDAAIIFITSNPDFALQGYDVNALHYLMKPLDGDILERLIESDYRRRFQNNFLVFKSGTQTLRIPIKDVICLETVGRRVEITLPDRTVEYPGKLSELLEGNEQFVRCHKAFAVNLRNIRELMRTDAIAVNGKTIPVSRTYTSEVQKAFLRQIRDG
jgi:DNA-binding LytR/AlgR family response regulator